MRVSFVSGIGAKIGRCVNHIELSSSLEADLKRMQDIEEGSFGYRPGHMKLNVWHNGWFDGNRAYFGDKTPDCSGLPTVKPEKKN